MINQTMLVGRISKLTKEDDGVASVTIAVPRSFKNEYGEYETDLIPCSLFKGVADSVGDYCKVGDLIGAKGRLQINNEILQFIAEKVTFLQASSN